MDSKRLTEAAACVALGAAIGYVVASNAGSSNTKESLKAVENGAKKGKSPVEQIVSDFLHAQSERNLDKMCDLVDEEIVYINEPHPPERAIRGKNMFREAFAASPCIWCEKADLKVLQMSYVPSSDTVFVERYDQFFIDGHWLAIPICGYLKVKNGKVVLWKDYWDYAKYKEFTTKTYGPDFRLFRTTVKTKQ